MNLKSKRSTRALMHNTNINLVASKRSQEEMIGFILIVVLVSVIALVFLIISLKKPVEMKTSSEASDFLYSSLLYTSSCQPNENRNYDLNDLIIACSNNENCLSGEKACEVLEKSYKELIEQGFASDIYKAYEFKVYAGNETNSLIYLKEGNFTKSMVGSEVPIYVSGENFYLKLELFY